MRDEIRNQSKTRVINEQHQLHWGFGFRISPFAPLLLLAGVGCGGVGDVSGQVTFEGKPLALGTVTFFSDQQGPQTGVIQSDGSYEVKSVPAGTVKVSVYSRDPRPKPGRRPLPRGKKDEHGVPYPHPAYSQAQFDAWFPIPSNYSDPRRSGLTLEVKKGPNGFDIELK